MKTLHHLSLRTADLSLFGVLFVAPYFMGGRHPVGRLVLVWLAVVLAVSWLASRCFQPAAAWVRSPGEWLLGAGVLLIFIQLVPLPHGFLTTVSPHTLELLPLWQPTASAPGALGGWSRISLTPESTQNALVMLLAYGLIFLVTVQRLESIADAERLLRAIGWAALLMASFGLVQYLASNGKFFWVYEHPFRNTADGVKGSFINRNHFTHFLALGLAPLMLSIVSRWPERSARLAGMASRCRSAPGVTFAAAIALGVVLFAGLLSLSRGGALAMAVAVVVATISFQRAGLIGRRYVAAVVAVSTLLCASLGIYGYQQVSNRLDDFASGSLDQLDNQHGRRLIWAANVALFRDHPIVGTGVGSHRDAHPIYLGQSLPVEFTHAESGYLQVASEAGLAGLVLLLTGIGTCLFWCVHGMVVAREPRQIAALGVVAAGLAASVVHALVDFVWYIPACMSVTVVLAACAQRLWQVSARPAGQPRRETRIASRGWAMLTLLALAVGGSMIYSQWGPARASRHWDDYLRHSLASTERRHTLLDGSQPQSSDSVDNTLATICDAKKASLVKTIRMNPNDARAHMRMAGVCIERFDQLQGGAENPMDVAQIGDAAIASQFPSRQALDAWLDRAVGPHRQLLSQALWHVRRGLQLCPLMGEGYLYLGQLAFLEGGQLQTRHALTHQALVVRPFDSDVLFAVGKERLMTGDLDGAIGYWKQCFHLGGTHQEQMVRFLAGRVPVRFLLESLQPRRADFGLMFAVYEPLAQQDELRQLCDYYADLASAGGDVSDEGKTVGLWLMLRRIRHDLGDTQGSLECARQAHRCAPSDFAARLALGESLLQSGRNDEATGHLKWCRQRKPGVKKVERLFQQAVRRRVAQAGRENKSGNSTYKP